MRRRTALVLALLVAACGTTQQASSPSATRPAIEPSAQPGSGSAAVSQVPQVETWAAAAPAPAALTEVAATVHEGAIWVAGGLDGSGQASDRVLIYDPGADTWAEGPSLPEGIHHAALVSDGSALYLVGGYVGGGFDRPTDAVRMLRGRQDPWVDHSPLPEPRAAGSAAWDGTRVVYAGGVGPDGVTAAVLARHDAQWRLSGRLSEAREHLAAASDGQGATYILGGRRGGLEGNRTAVDVVTGDVVRRLGDLPTPRGGVAAFWWPSLGACLIGGESPTGTNAEVECIDDTAATLSLPPLDQPRHGLGAAVVDGAAYALLGGPQPGLFVSDAVERLALPE
jgi:Kelch motif protein